MTGPAGAHEPDRSHPPVPPVSRRDAPTVRSAARHRELAAAYAAQGGDYDRLRPGYPEAAVDCIVAAAPAVADAADLGAGTGKLAWALAARGLHVTAIDPSQPMLEAALAARPADLPQGAGTVSVREAAAEATGLPDASVDLVTAAQAWHWFDVAATCTEVARILRPGGVLALVWNTLDVAIPWVHRYSRIMHAGDVLKDGFTPPLAAGFTVRERSVHRWEDLRPTHELIDLARTRSFVATASEDRRARVLANLDWYLHEHLGHAPGAPVGMPYRTDVIVCARAA